MLWKLKLAEFASLESGPVGPAWGTTPLTGGSDLGKKRDSVACAVHVFSYKNASVLQSLINNY
jgi:hypothetical protein